MSAELSKSRAGVRALACVVALTAVLGASTVRARGTDADVDPLALSAVLLQGGDVDRAERVLADVDAKSPGLDRARFFALRGFVHLRQERFEASYRDLVVARAEGNRSGALVEQIARAAYGAERYEDALRALDDVGAGAYGDESLVILRVRCHRALGDTARALYAVRGARGRAGATPRLALEETDILLDASLFEEARSLAVELVTGGEADDALALIESFRKRGAARDAIELGEAARLAFPDDTRFSIAVARAYADVDLPLAAAAVLEDVARRDPTHAVDVAELLRRAGRLESALTWNAVVPEEDAKLRQRFGLLLDLGRVEEAAALLPRLERTRVIDDDEVAYAAAWALFQLGRVAEAEQRLRAIDDPDVFAKSATLLQAIASCRADVRTCP